MSVPGPLTPPLGSGDLAGVGDRAVVASAWNLANAVTMVRIALVPVFGWLLLHDGGSDPTWRWLAAGTFTVAMLTDRLDGSLARSRGLVTDVGKIMDPIADKALTGMALVGLSLIGEVWWWVTVVVLGRELAITAVRLAIIRRTVVPAGRGGKLKTLLQSVGLALLTAPLSGLAGTVAWLVMALAVVVTVLTGLAYLVRMRALPRSARGGPG
ncbi:MAG TPA: CDP-diacylglycerol--glycerol-3-phosphate 3-phosphatidyltransferase [Dermatophilaceae bacterium]|nr:CDP-diacylglycerol--glycerol-3-phosphate 3-phosphatidyltransferase [Dermatophilaceae bacterium]